MPTAKLGVRPGQVRLEGVDAQGQLFGDLLVRKAAGRQLGDPLLPGRRAARTRARHRMLRPRPGRMGERWRSGQHVAWWAAGLPEWFSPCCWLARVSRLRSWK